MRGGAATLLLLSFSPALLAQPGDSQRAYLELFVNEASKDTVLVILRGGDTPDDALIAVEDLEKAGLHGLRGTREVFEGRPYLSLRSLGPEIRFRFDAQALAVRISAPPSVLDRTELDLRAVVRPEGMVLRRDTSGFLNYSLTADGNGTVTGAGELGASLRGNLAFTGFSVGPDHRVIRGLSYVVVDDPERMRRLQVGDAIAISSELGGSAQLAGLSLTREFSLDPYFVRQPLPRLSGAVLTPSTLEVYVNGALVRHEPVAPGPFEVRNLPVGSGVGQVSYVVRDAFGRTEEFASPYYSAAGVLADGLSDFGYHLGFRRLDFGSVSSEYGPPELLARHRFGIGDWLTAGYRFESAIQRAGGTSLLASGGPTAAVALPVGGLDLLLGVHPEDLRGRLGARDEPQLRHAFAAGLGGSAAAAAQRPGRRAAGSPPQPHPAGPAQRHARHGNRLGAHAAQRLLLLQRALALVEPLAAAFGRAGAAVAGLRHVHLQLRRWNHRGPGRNGGQRHGLGDGRRAEVAAARRGLGLPASLHRRFRPDDVGPRPDPVPGPVRHVHGVV